MMPPVHIIAEAGTNHNGQLGVAKDLVNAAVVAGVDSVKVQIINPEGLYLPEILEHGKYHVNEVFAKRAAFMMSDDDYRCLADYCQSMGTRLSASIFDSRGIKLLDELDPPYFKIASCDLNNSRLLIEAAERGRRMIVSTGMATLAEIERAVLDITGTGNSKVVLMHCVSVYPCLTSQMQIGFLKRLKTRFGFSVGLSDHTENNVVVIMAVAVGAEWVEKHLTLDRKAQGFDHAYAMEPDALADFVRDVRVAEQAYKLQEEKICPKELFVKRRARRGLYAACNIQKGELVTEKNVLVVRPENFLEPNDLASIIGKRVNRLVRRFEPFQMDQVS